MRPKRPYETLYYAVKGTDSRGPDSKGYAASETGAIRAAVVRVFLGQYAQARVFEEGVLIYTILKNRKGIGVYYGASHP